MSEEGKPCLVRARREIARYTQDLADVAAPLDRANNEDDPVPLTFPQIRAALRQLDNIHVQLSTAYLGLIRCEVDEEGIARDGENRTRIFSEWDRVKQMAIAQENACKAESAITNITRSVTRMERKHTENPTKSYKDSLLRIDHQMDDLRKRLNESLLPSDHALWMNCEDIEDRLESLLSQESAPPDSKGICKMHVRGPYKISDLVVPKFNGKIQQWLSFWEEFDHAVNKKADMDDSTKMVYLKQAILDPGLKQTIADLGIRDEAYSAAIKLLQDRFDKPRIIHRLCCENIKALSTNNNSRASLTEMADKIQHILTGLTRLGSLGASEILTSMAELVMNKELKHHWLTQTAKMTTTPPVTQVVIAFIRERADQAEGEESTASTKQPSERNKQNKSNIRTRSHNSLASAAPAVTSAATSASSSTTPQPVRSVVQPAKTEYIPPKYSCPICSEHHYAYHCNVFKDYSPAQRKEHVSAHSLCSNCLKPGHASETCRLTYRCKFCRAKHDSLLHEDQTSVASPALALTSAAAAAKDGLVMTANVLLTGTRYHSDS